MITPEKKRLDRIATFGQVLSVIAAPILGVAILTDAGRRWLGLDRVS